MRRRRISDTGVGPSDVEEALAALSAEDLRELVRDILTDLEEESQGRAIDRLLNRAARGESGWAPSTHSDESVAEVLAFAKAAAKVGYANPSDVDDALRKGSKAFLRQDYAGALRIFRALLRPISEVEIDLGQHELVDEVLTVNITDCSAQYVVSAYMTTKPEGRGEAVHSAIAEVNDIGELREVISEMERVAVEPLPQLNDFLSQWRSILEEEKESAPTTDWGWNPSRWLREVVHRIEGAEGLAQIARSTRHADDLRAWCRFFVESKDWNAALTAYEEAAELLDDEYARAEFLDGAALVAQLLGRRDLPSRLERAWRAEPSLVRLRRWLGWAGTSATLRKRSKHALEACPKEANRQKAFLHILLGELGPAAKLMETAPGLGWSRKEHPGHLLIAVFRKLLNSEISDLAESTGVFASRWMGRTELESLRTSWSEAYLVTPELDQILELSGIGGPLSTKAHGAVIEAMRKSAEGRLEGVTIAKRRRDYDHAAWLVAICAEVDPSPETSSWVTGIRSEYRRYPALKRELERHLRES